CRARERLPGPAPRLLPGAARGPGAGLALPEPGSGLVPGALPGPGRGLAPGAGGAALQCGRCARSRLKGRWQCGHSSVPAAITARSPPRAFLLLPVTSQWR
ncbi:hypothetical protein Nmel_016390, partial [Mimus melanotis]